MLGFPVGWLGAETSLLETFGAGSCMLGIQYLLLNTHKARKVLPLEVVPNQSEIFAAVICFWFVYLGSTKTLFHVVNFIFWVLPKLEGDDKGIFNSDNTSSTTEVVRWTISSTNFLFQLFNLIILTWQFHQFTLFVLETIIPFLATLTTTKLSKPIERFQSRFNALLAFLNLITIGHPMPPRKSFQNPPRSYSINLSTTQITLQRTKTQPLPQNQKDRTLSWTLTIPPPLLDEIKETLGPPGGFGELGFSVGKSEIKFECMGVGSTFGLVFGVEKKGAEDPGMNPQSSATEGVMKGANTGRIKKEESKRRKTK